MMWRYDCCFILQRYNIFGHFLGIFLLAFGSVDQRTIPDHLGVSLIYAIYASVCPDISPEKQKNLVQNFEIYLHTYIKSSETTINKGFL